MFYHSSLSRPLSLLPLLLFVVLLYSVDAASTITGTVYDKQRNPLPNLDVELLNDFYQMLDRAKTDGSGRYQFSGLSDGRYTVRVHGFRYDLQDQEVLNRLPRMNLPVAQLYLGTSEMETNDLLPTRWGRDADYQ